MKKLTALWLSLLLAFGTLTGCADQIGIIGGEDGPTAIITSDSASAVSVTEDGQYDVRFGIYEGTLPDGSYHECDLNTRGADKRGAERLVYADDGRIYYTADHYETFEEITE